METIGFYLLRSAVWIAGFALVYLLFLRNERFFLLNRIYLVAGIIASVTLPLVTIRYVVEVPVIQAEATAGQVTSVFQDGGSWQHNLAVLLLAVWLTGVVIVLARFVVQVLPVLRAAGKAERTPGYPVRVIRSSEFPGSFSLFSLVIVNPSVSETETREIMNHELVHIRQMHWFDLVLSSLLCAVQWFNPAAWIYVGLIRQNHEYLADEEALQRSSDPAVYKAVLLNQIAGSPVIDLGNFFSYSLNKKRFTMMKNKISSPYRMLRLLLILPVAALVLYAFAEPNYRVTAIGADSPPPGAVQAEITKSVRGVILSEDGNPLEGAVIVIKGTTSGTTTDKQGRFDLDNVADDAVLVISFVGYETAAVKASAGPEITVRMKKKSVVMEKVVVVGYAQNPAEESDAPPPPPPPPPSALAGNPLIVIDGVISKKPFSEISPDEIASINVIKDEAAVKAYGEKGKEGVIEITTKKASDKKSGTGGDIRKKAEEKEEVFVVVEEMPEFPGGQEAMFAFVANNFRYPDEAKAQNINGLVRISFVVRANGKVSDVKVEESAHPLLDAEAVRVVKSMPDWKPGTQHGKPVDVGFTIPVEFNLKGEMKVQKSK